MVGRELGVRHWHPEYSGDIVTFVITGRSASSSPDSNFNARHKKGTHMSSFSIFIDAAGVSGPSEEEVFTFATSIAYGSLKKETIDKLSSLRREISDWGVGSEKEDFRFHAYHLLQPACEWRTIDLKRRKYVAKNLRAQASRQPYLVLLVDKNRGGARSMIRFRQDMRKAKEAKPDLTEAIASELEHELSEHIKKKSTGKHAEVFAVLLGYINAFVGILGCIGQAKVIMDMGLVTHLEGWNIALDHLRKDDTHVRELASFFDYPPSRSIDWHLATPIAEESSRSCYGLQLADFVAYTTKRRWLKQEGDLASQMSIVAKSDFKRLKDYEGIFLSVPEMKLVLSSSDKHFWRQHIVRRE